MRLLSIIKKIGATSLLSFLVFSILGTIALAQTPPPAAPGVDCTKDYCALTTIPGLTEKGKPVNPVETIKKIYGISIGIGGILAVIMIIWAGVEYATTEAITGKSEAKEKWQGALFGLVLLLASYIILRTINVDLVNINLDLGTPIKGEVVDPMALQNALDAYTRSIGSLRQTRATIEYLNQDRTAKSRQLDELIADSGNDESPAAQKLKAEIDLIDASLTNLEKKREEEQRAISAAQAAVASSTVAGSQYCVSYSQNSVIAVGVGMGTGVKSTIITKKECSITPAGCNTLRFNISQRNGPLKADATGFISSIGPCQPEPKTN